jgi:hypothetical protein
MTATERRYAGSSDNILSMDDAKVYGETFAQLSFKEAIEIGILSDYKIITLLISNKEVKKLIEQNAFVKPTGKDWDKETEARTLASLIALRKAMTHYPIHHAVTFHSSIKKAEAFEQSQTMFSQAFPKFTNVQSFHVSGAMPTSIRGKIVDEFAATEKGIITNAKCLTEGVDVPNIDCVLFADPRKSTVDIVQAVGRALRKKEGKDFGYVILPVFTESDNKEEIINSDAFKEILSTIRALASNDERIIEYFRDISKGTKKRNADSLIEFDIDELIAEAINENELIDGLQLTTWNKLAKLSWMPFEEAREFVRALNFESTKEWFIYSKSNKKPFDLPTTPNEVYKQNWKGYGDFLGNSIIATQDREYCSFLEAKAVVINLKLKSTMEWMDYCKSGNKPQEIPNAPDWVYKKKGWISWGDFLGHGNIASFDKSFESFEKAREFAQNLKLKNQREWHLYWKENGKNNVIPTNPSITFKKHWNGWGDFLGTGIESMRLKKFRNFNEAKKFIQTQNIKSTNEWKQFVKQNKLPTDIPRLPDLVYKQNGWISWGDFLGTNTIAPHQIVYRNFDDAKKFVQNLKLKSSFEWNKYAKSSQKPIDLPNAPHLSKQYKNEWKNWGDWLGTNKIAPQQKKYRNFVEARKFVQLLNLKSFADWKKYCKSKNKPDDIPYHPQRKYANEWISFEDFLGIQKKPDFLNYEEAKKLLAKFKLNTTSWRKFVKTEKRPLNIPSNPDKSYKDNGWKGWADFLGKDTN